MIVIVLLTRKPTNNSAHTKMGDILGATLKDGSDDPDNRGKLKNTAPSKTVTNPSSTYRANETSCRHGRSDAALLRGVRVAEVVQVLVTAYKTRKGQDLNLKHQWRERNRKSTYRPKHSWRIHRIQRVHLQWYRIQRGPVRVTVSWEYG